MTEILKRQIIGASLVAGSALSCGGSTPPAQPVAPAAAVQPATPPVSGGGRTIVVPIEGSTVAFRILFFTGSADDPKGKEGLTQLAAHLMAEGGTSAMSYRELLNALYPMAADIDVQVGKEQVVFSGRVHADHAQRYAELLAEVVLHPRLAEADFHRLRDDMRNDIEKRLRATDDENLAKAMLDGMIYGSDHPYGHLNGGTAFGLKSITLEDIRAHIPRVFGKKRLLIGIAGATTPALQQTLEKAFAGLPEGEERIAAIPPAPAFDATEVLIAEKPSKAVSISIGYPLDITRGDPDFPALALVQSYFGEHRQFHGVLMDELREKRGLNYGDYAYVEHFVQEGGGRHARTNIARRQQAFSIWIRSVDTPNDAVFALRLALYYLDRMVGAGIPQKGLDDARLFLTGYTRLWALTPTRRLGYALDDEFYGTKDWLDTYRGALAGLDLEHLNAALRKHLRTRPLKIAIVAQDGEGLKKLLLSGDKVVKTYGAAVDPSVKADDEKAAALSLNLDAAHVRVIKADQLFVR